MKLKALRIFVFIFLILLSGCGQSRTEPKVAKNVIAFMELTPEQQEIIDLLSPETELLFFEYGADAGFGHFTLWLEVYENGELTENQRTLETFSPGKAVQNGKLAITITEREDFFDFSFAQSDDAGGKISYSLQVDRAGYEGTARAFKWERQPVAIEEGKEIVLYSSIFTDGNTIRTFDHSEERLREAVAEYDFVHLIKCKFERDA